MSGVQFARRLRVPSQSANAPEKAAEASGAIQVKTLRRAAEARRKT
jgi:hypothetical protein